MKEKCSVFGQPRRPALQDSPLKTVNCLLKTCAALLPKRRKRVIGALAFGFENDLQEASEVAIRPAFLLEPAEIFRGEFVERTTFETAEGHGPGAELFPVGGGLGEVHRRSMGRGWGI